MYYFAIFTTLLFTLLAIIPGFINQGKTNNYSMKMKTIPVELGGRYD